jgi:signal transduction histidine kinase
MSAEFDRLSGLYATALRSFLRRSGERPLSRAYALGREALSAGLGILDMATIHDSARTRLRESERDVASASTARAAEQKFFAEALSSFEMVHRSTSETNAALRKVNDSLEREVRRMAHALHDDVGPLLFLVHMSLHTLAEGLPAATRPRVQEVRDRLDQVEEQLRRLSHELRPMILEDMGLAAALRYLAEGVAIRAGIPVTVECKDPAGLSPTTQSALYRIIQQALANVAKHAHATHASVHVTMEPRSVECTIADDGIGFKLSATTREASVERGLGLVGMRERADALGGTFEVSSAPGKGTRIKITIPSEV